MRCQCCKKVVANIQIRDVEDWSVSDVIAICEKCAAYVIPKFLASPSPLVSAQEALEAGRSELEAATGETISSDDADEPIKPSLKCGACGMEFAEFQSRGRLGCPECYHAFAEPLEPILEHIHGVKPDAHPGRKPGKPAPDSRPAIRKAIQRLENQMQSAVEAENYEHAAQLRDQIKELEEKLTKDAATE